MARMLFSNITSNAILAQIPADLSSDTQNETGHGSEGEGEFKYYNASGVFVGKSSGFTPEADLYKKAHYVILNDSDMIKNLDPVSVVQRDIARYREELLTVPISHMNKIMELNHLIQNLEKFLDRPTEQAS